MKVSVAVPSNFPYATEYVLPYCKEIFKLFMYVYVISIMMNIMYCRCDYLIYMCVIYSPKRGHKILLKVCVVTVARHRSDRSH